MDSDIDGDVAPVPPAKRSRKVIAPVLLSGFTLCVIFHCVGDPQTFRYLAKAFKGEDACDALLSEAVPNLQFVGILQWTLDRLTPECDDCPDNIVMRTFARRKGKKDTAAYLSYHLVALAASGVMDQPENPFLATLAFLRGLTYHSVIHYGFVKKYSSEALFGLWADRYGASIFDNIVHLHVPVNLLSRIYYGEMDIIHTVALSTTAKVPRRFFLPSFAPTIANVKNFLGVLANAAAGDGDVPTGESKWHGLNVKKVIAYLKASSHVKEQRDMPRSRVHFRELEAALAPDDPTLYLRPFGDDWNYCSLIRARPNLDACCMLIFRTFFHMLTNPTVYVYLDASTQWRGVELFVTNIEVVVKSVANFFRRRFMPVVSIGPYMYTASGKGYSFLWQVFLMAGPTFTKLLVFLNSVFCLCTDQGTEARIIMLPDILPEFCVHIGVRVPKNYIRRAFLLPFCLPSPGWHHCFDGLTQFGLFSLEWFPAWLAETKAVLHFMRNNSGHLYDHFIRVGMFGAAAVFKACKFTTLIDWRWKKLKKICKQLRAAFNVLHGNADHIIGYLGTLKDTNKCKSMYVVMDEFALYWLQFQFITWYTLTFTGMEEWVDSCFCHSWEFSRNTPVQCDYVGRLLPYAFDFATRRFDEILAEVAEWCADDWRGNVDFFRKIQGCVRAVVSRGRLKIRHLDRIPFLIAKLGYVQGARARCIEQYGDGVGHDRVSDLFSKSGSPLLAAITAMEHDLDLSNANLCLAVTRYRESPMNDLFGEVGHAQFAREGARTNASHFAWRASSMRLSQNLDDVVVLPSATQEDTQSTYDNYKTVIQTSKHKRDVRVSRKEFFKRLYTCNVVFDPSTSTHADFIEGLRCTDDPQTRSMIGERGVRRR